MEKNEKRRKSLARGYDSELEKFKRRLIRAVARMLLHEKRNEQEVWEGLKQETGCDCKELWSRMHALTMKKLSRLLEVQDRTDMLPKAARMSVTDWLLFDMILVHEDFDVIGMTETSQSDRQVLVDLFLLVEKFKVEFVAGERLADAWTRLTVEYNKDNRCCSPMLLQRRWYQLKLATRARFYKFWSIYKGQIKRVSLAESYRPTHLQINIAKTYKPLVVKQFMMWEDLVLNKLVILPEEFEPKHLRTQTNDESPDVMCLETSVETIEIDLDSDIELEYRKPEEDKKEDEATIKIKEEPTDFDETADESVPYENRQEKISNFADAVMEATAMELNEMELEEDINEFVNSSSANVEVPSNDDDIIEIVAGNNDDVTEVLAENNDDVTEVLAEKYDDDEVSEVTEEICLDKNNKTVTSEDIYMNNVTDEVIPVVEDQAEKITPAIEVNNEIHTIDDDVHVEENTTNISNEPETLLPQITSIFGGVEVTNETLSTISMLTAHITNSGPKTVIENAETHEVTKLTDIELSSDVREEDYCITIEDDEVAEVSDKSSEIDTKPVINKSWFGELSNDIDFADDGIQLVDDGISYRDEEFEFTIGNLKTEIKLEIEEHEVTPVKEKDEEIPKVDKKLLMVPVVPTVKLDDMGILPIDLLQHVDNKTILDIIDFKSKPIKMVIDDTSSESSEEEIKQEINRVKLSSVLLQKPRSRTYNPIQLCKNPDFNTRLKRLSIGFFSSPRNISLFKACHPLTIDVSKAFESRLVHGTMYLKASEGDDISKTTDFKESSHVSVVPSAMPVQSLIDSSNIEITRPTYTPIVPTPVETSLACERNKVINLPDISEIRRINQKLLTAQVTPLQLKNNCLEVPVTILPGKNIHDDNRKTLNTNPLRRYIPGPASRTKIPPAVVDITKEATVTNPLSTDIPNAPKVKIAPWKPRNLKQDIPWFIKNQSIYDADTLLALDTLNKMLFLLTDEADTTKKRVKKSRGPGRKFKDKEPNSAPIEIIDSEVADKKDMKSKKTDKTPIEIDDNDDAQVVSETKVDNLEAKDCRKCKNHKPPKPQKPIFCCWARERICQMIYSKKRVSKHNCAFPRCSCCCKLALADYFQELKAAVQDSNTDYSIQNQQSVYTDVNSDSNNKNSSVDVAEIIPIVPEPINANTLISEENKQSNMNKIIPVEPVVTDITAQSEVFVESTTPINELGMEVEISSNDDVNVGAEVSVPSSCPIPVECNDSIKVHTTTATTVDNVIVTPRFRISHSIAPKSALHAIARNQELCRGQSTPLDQIKVTAGEIPTNLKTNRIETNFVKVKNIAPKRTPRLTIKVPDLGPKLAPKTYSNQKMIYLNSKKISDLPSDNPIYLGKNKILLTTAKFPPNFKAFEELQRTIKQTLALPIGIHLILKPDGQLTYVKTPKAIISKRTMAKLPQLMEEFQQQINGSLPLENPVDNEVINLSDDEILENGENYDKAIVSEETKDQSKSSVDTLDSPMLEIQTDNKVNVGSQNDNLDGTTHEKLDATQNINLDITLNNEIVDFTQNDNLEAKQNVNLESTQNDNLDAIQNDILDATQNNDMNAKQNYSLETKQNHNLEASQNDNLDATLNDSLDATQNGSLETIQSENLEATQHENLDALHIGNLDKSQNSNLDVTRNDNSEALNNNNSKNIQASQSIDRAENEIPTTGHEDATEKSNPNDIGLENPQTSNQSTNNDVNKNESNVNISGKTKNILSDLMAMSGIEQIDIAPTSTTISQDHSSVQTQQEVTSQVNFSLTSEQMLCSPSATPSSLASLGTYSDGTPANHNLLLQALTAITSLSELKYACSQNGAFFKLDFESGILVPINVCMKKLNEAAQVRFHLKKKSNSYMLKTNSLFGPKPVIDLTEDDCEISEVTKPTQPRLQSLLISNQPTSCVDNSDVVLDTNSVGQFTSTTDVATNTASTDTNITAEASTSDSNEAANILASNTALRGKNKASTASSNADKATLPCNEPFNTVKPLKLFKSGAVDRPSILVKKLKEIQNRVSKAMTAQDVIRRQLKRKRDSVSVESINAISFDSSSDEEPLSQIAKKMRATELEMAGTENNITELNEQVAIPVDVVNDSDIPQDDSMEVQELEDERELSISANDEMNMEYLEEDLLDENEGEDCILGV